MSKRTPIYNPEPFTQGDTWSLTVSVLDNNGAAKNLTGYSAKYEIREKPGSPIILSLTSTPAAGVSINTTTAEITVSISATQSALFNFNKAKCSLKLISGTGIVQTLFIGDQEIYSRIVQ